MNITGGIQAVAVVASGLTGSPLAAAIVGGVFLLVNTLVNFLLIKYTSSDKRKKRRKSERVGRNRKTQR